MRLTSLDLAVIVAYLAGITLFGIAFRRGQSTVRDYFLGGRTAPWWALALSIVATETSTLTIVGTPALAFAGNLTFLQFVFGYLVGRVVIVLLFLPHYFRGEYYTAYQLMERRFGAKVKAVAASTFLVTRVLAEGVRVAAIALVVTAALGTGQRTSILLIMALVLIYTFEGGMKAVIWTDVVQFILYFLWLARRIFSAAAPDSRRMGNDRASGCAGAQIPHFRFLVQPDESRETLHILVRRNRRHILYDGEPRNGSDHRAAAAGRKIRTRKQTRAARQRRRHSFAIRVVSGAGSDALCLARRACRIRGPQLRFRFP